jgi:hypothetical protein
MNLEELERTLISVARKTPADERVPYAFEKRVLARLRSCAPMDVWSVWAQALWRATAPCIAIALLLAAWSLFTPKPPPPSNTGSFDVAQEFENTVLADIELESSTD